MDHGFGPTVTIVSERRRCNKPLIPRIVSSADFQQFALQNFCCVLSHPMEYAKTLIQVGYEPWTPKRSTFFGREYLCLPNLFQYMKYIKSVDGFLGCYRGLAPRLCQSVVSTATYKLTSNYQRSVLSRETNKNKKDWLSVECGSMDHFLKHAKDTGYEIIAVSAATIASQPFYVIAVRTMAQFVGRETKYSCSILECLRMIFNEEGLSGFFRGVVPRLIGDVISITVSASLIFLIQSYMKPEKHPQPHLEMSTVMVSNMISNSLAYQFHVVNAVINVNGVGLKIGEWPHAKKYESWLECWQHLYAMQQLKRGSSIIGRYYMGPSLLRNRSGAPAPSYFEFGPIHPPELYMKERKHT